MAPEPEPIVGVEFSEYNEEFLGGEIEPGQCGLDWLEGIVEKKIESIKTREKDSLILFGDV